jgi:hypothetical protein
VFTAAIAFMAWAALILQYASLITATRHDIGALLG